MTSKVPTLFMCWRTPIWVPLICRFSSVPCASHCVQTVPRPHSSRSSLADFDSDVGYLRKELHPDRFSCVLDTIPDQFSAVEILKWASHQQNLKHTAMNYAQIILRLGLVSRLDEMENFLMEMVKVELSRDEVEKALGFLIDAFCRNSITKEALCVFQVASVGNFRLEISAYNALLSALVAEGGNFEHVVFVYKEMVKSGVLPDVETLNCLIEVLLETDRVDSAIGQFHRMDKKGCVPNSHTFKMLLTDLCSRDRIDDSIKILAKMFKINCKPNGNFYYSIIPLFCKFGRLEVGTKLLRMMISSGLSPDPQLSDTLIRCLCEDGQVDIAVKLLDELSEMDATPFETYMDVVLAYCKVGRSAQALNFLQKSQCYHVEPYNTLLKVYREDSKFAEASALLKKMRKQEVINDVSWSILINGLFRNGHVRRAFMVLGGMIVSSCIPSEATLSAVICGQCRMLQYENALVYFQDVVDKNWSLDSISYNELVHGLCNLKRFEEAAEVVSYMSAKGGTLNGSLLNLLTSSLCHMNKVTKAINLHLLAFCNGVCESVDTFVVIMSYLLEHKRLNQVLVFWSRILVEGHSLDTGTYCLLIRGLCAKSMTREIIILFDQMISDGLFPDSECLDTLISFMSENSQVHLIAWSLSKVLEKGMINSTTYNNTVISCLLEEGYRDEACRFLDIMLEMGWFPDAEAHGLLVDHIDKQAVNKVAKDVDDDRVISILAEGLQQVSNYVPDSRITR